MSRKRTKQYLMLLMVIGLVSIAAGGGGTFASFNAETANSGNTFATGTLYLHDKVGNGNTCTSESNSLNQNVPSTVGGSKVGGGDNCDALFSLPASTSYSAPFQVNLTLTNAGSLAAQDIEFQLNGAGCAYTDTVASGLTLAPITLTYSANGAGLSAPLSTSNPITSIPVNALGRVVYAGSQVTLDDGTHTQIFIASADAPQGATSISVNSLTPNWAYTTSTPTTNVKTTDAITSLTTTGSTTSSILNGAAIQVREGGTTSSVTTSTHYETFTTSAAVGYNASGPIAINSAVPNFGYGADTVYAAFGPNTACSSIPYTITETNSTFDGPSEGVTTGTSLGTGQTKGYEGCAYGTAGTAGNAGGCLFDQADNIAGIPTRAANSFASLALASGGGTGNATHLTGLDPGGARYFIITVYPQFGDPVMGQTALFDMVWHMDQA